MNSRVAGSRSIKTLTVRSRPVRRLRVGTKCGFGRHLTSNIRSASTGTPCLKPKLSSVSTSRARVRSRERPMKNCRSSCTFMSDVSTISSARFLMAVSRSRSSRMPSVADRSRASGCGRRVSLKRRTSVVLLASRKMSTGLSPRMLRRRASTRGNAERKFPSRTSTTMATLSISTPRTESVASIGISVVGRLSTQK